VGGDAEEGCAGAFKAGGRGSLHVIKSERRKVEVSPLDIIYFYNLIKQGKSR
jgi:hypothetical protein